MPIYEYRCRKGHLFEVMQRISDDAVATCEVCGAPVQRVFHPIAVHFKGSGFYNTDYGTRKRAREMKESSSDGAGKKDSGSASDGASKSAASSSESGSPKSSESGAGTSAPKASAA